MADDRDSLDTAIAGRPGWRRDGLAAIYEPGGAWSAHVRATARPERAGQAWHCAVLHTGIARYSLLCGTSHAAVQWAEQTTAAATARHQ